ncbi:SirB2 family protein [Aquisalimonas sp. 2447]|uniref:SirB2 family protein n=1 Tax=Aquisalimonas sp. 2447 TaxID=2740807 RepID=UPI001432320D|nr:SirB2 family protein [Aquisalimonas sp. 2447]QIT55789.1 SirB2 family protein [Aquisalimonas sp. 2447]
MAEYYTLIKHVHQGSAILSVALFILRGIWMMAGSGMLQRAWVRIVPHVIDTVLLVSALLLAWIIAQYPFVHGWVTAKVVGLVIYIALGMIALKRGRTMGIRVVAWVAALMVFAYIMLVAVTKQVLPLIG